MECEGGGGQLRGEGGGRGLFWKRQGKIFVYESYRLGRLWSVERERGGYIEKSSINLSNASFLLGSSEQTL